MKLFVYMICTKVNQYLDDIRPFHIFNMYHCHGVVEIEYDVHNIMTNI